MKNIKVKLFNINNSNTGRCYDKQAIDSCIEYVKERNAIGDLMLGKFGDVEHPDESINLKDVTHKVTDLSVENNELVADITLLDTPMGKIAQMFIDNHQMFTPKVVFNDDFEETIDEETGQKVITKCSIKRIDYIKQ